MQNYILSYPCGTLLEQQKQCRLYKLLWIHMEIFGVRGKHFLNVRWNFNIAKAIIVPF